jgi:hypothetical protein
LIENQTWNQHSHYRKAAHFISRTIERQSAVSRFFGTPRRRPEFSQPTSADGLSPMRTPQGDFVPTTGGNPFNQRRKRTGCECKAVMSEPRGERNLYKSPVTKNEANGQTKQRDLFQAT